MNGLAEPNMPVSTETPAPAQAVTLDHVLADLNHAFPGTLSFENRRNLDAICRKIALTGTLLSRYGENWGTPAEPFPLIEDEWHSALQLLASWSDVLKKEAGERGLSLKLLNAVLQAADVRALPGHLQDWARARLNEAAIDAAETSVSAFRFPPPASRSPRTLPLTVLAYEGPCLRAYLALMRRAGLRPQRILLTVLTEHPSSRKPVGRWFPGRLRAWYAEKAQDAAMNHWPRRIGSAHPELLSTIAHGLKTCGIHDAASLIAEMYGPPRYERYAETVDRVMARGLRDESIREILAASSPGPVLFTGGGILPASLIHLPGLRFLHVHPGLLPHVRGADGLLWSTLIRGRPAMSCFYQAAGLDTGDIIAVREYPPLVFRAAAAAQRVCDRTLYRALFGFIDPLLRADMLVNGVLSGWPDAEPPEVTPQDTTEGLTYHFMHPRLRERVLGHLFA